MGYFSKRKKQERENIFFKIMLIILGILTVLTVFSGLAPFAERIKDYLFQIYLANLLVFFYALILRRFLYVLSFLVFLIINYAQLASYANVFTNTGVNAVNQVSLQYEPSLPLKINSRNVEVLNTGHFNFEEENHADFVTFEKNKAVITLINTDLQNPNPRHYEALADFIIHQDNPVVVIGRLGHPAWSREVRRFLQATNLQVKNRTVLISNESSFSLFEKPVFYVLGFDNTGIVSLETGFDGNTAKPVVTSDLIFY